MYRDHRIGVVVPAYNEEGLIGDVIQTMPDYVDRVYVVDDSSTDGTWAEVKAAAHEDRATLNQRELYADIGSGTYAGTSETRKTPNAAGSKGNNDPEQKTDGGEQFLEQRAVVHPSIGRVLPIQHHENRGAGGAIKTGYLAALVEEVDIAVTIDGDGQMDPDQMPRLLDPIVDDKADYAKGNRLLFRKRRSQMPRFRFFGNMVLSFLTKIASGYWKTMDPQNGYTAISRHALQSIRIESVYEYYGYCNDLLVKANVHGLRVADVAIPAIYGEEESKIKYRTYIPKVSWMLLKNFLWRLKVKYLVLDFHPLALFYLFGVATVSLGVLEGIWSVYSWKVWNSSLFVRGSVSLLVCLVGVMFVVFAMLFDMEVNRDKEVQIRE